MLCEEEADLLCDTALKRTNQASPLLSASHHCSSSSNTRTAATAAPHQAQSCASSHHIGGQLVTRQILDVFMLRVDDLRQLPAVDHLLVDPHIDHCFEAARRLDIVPDYFGNGGAPAGRQEQNISSSL